MKKSKYVSKKPDPEGFVAYTADENAVWAELFNRQMKLLENRACKEYLDGIKALGLTADHIPQIPEVNERLRALSGWEVSPVPALIGFQEFFELMSNKKFPAATFIRSREEIDYLQEPDIFHEIFGHCPLITLPVYADFMYEYGKLGLNASHKDRVMLARLYWFTVEFGLIQTHDGLRIYGGGILSSYGESQYCLDSDKPIRKLLEPVDAFRTPYRIDIYQPLYFVIKDFSALFKLSKLDLLAMINEARALGMHPPLFEPKIPDDGRFL
ncbi:MAG: phenylalanine 4-monooxygenase [Proteobacteria bacterium]|nr:phenylalanine 4-monooxygenase [Pseudomonadota bacterium]